MKLKASLFGACAIVLSTAASAQDIERYRDPSLPPNVPFASAVSVGEAIYVAGHIGNVPGTVDIVEGGAGPETTQMMENVRATLEAVGASLDDVVSCTIYFRDLEDYAVVNEAYAPFFPNGFPARAAIGVDDLVFGANVEIECIAHRAETEE